MVFYVIEHTEAYKDAVSKAYGSVPNANEYETLFADYDVVIQSGTRPENFKTLDYARQTVDIDFQYLFNESEAV